MGEDLRSKNKGELIDLINQLRTENIALKAAQELFLQQSERIEKLERSFYLQQQYVRRDTIEITGIPATVEQVQLENEVIKIYNAAGVVVDSDAVKKRDIQAVHRIGKKGTTICKFLNRKFANQGLYSSAKLKGKELYGPNTSVYINSSFCDEFRHLNYLVRKAKKSKWIFRYKVKNGVNFVKMCEGDDDFQEVTHKSDLIRLKIIADDDA